MVNGVGVAFNHGAVADQLSYNFTQNFEFVALATGVMMLDYDGHHSILGTASWVKREIKTPTNLLISPESDHQTWTSVIHEIVDELRNLYATDIAINNVYVMSYKIIEDGVDMTLFTLRVRASVFSH